MQRARIVKGIRDVADATAATRSFGVSRSNDALYDVSMDISESIVASAVAIGQLLVVEAHEVQDGGVQVMDVDSVFDCSETELVR